MQKLYNKTLSAAGSMLLFLVLFAGAAGLSSAIPGDINVFETEASASPAAAFHINRVINGSEEFPGESSREDTRREQAGQSGFLLFFVFNAVAAGAEKGFILLLFAAVGLSFGFKIHSGDSGRTPVYCLNFIKFCRYVIASCFKKLLKYLTCLYDSPPLGVFDGVSGKYSFRTVSPALKQIKVRVLCI